MGDEIRILHRDRDLLVVHKPAGIATTAMDQGDCLVERVKRLDPKAPRLHPTSRLDSEVSGIVTFARTRRATESLLEARRQGAYRRLYLGVCESAPSPSIGRWEAPIGIDSRDRRLRQAGSTLAPKTARTDYEVAERGEHRTLLYLRPQTGRTHQLRVHAAAAGAPLLGDIHYGGARRVVLPNGRVVTARRVMLHCTYVGLPGIFASEPIALLDPPPEEMRRLWSALGGSDAQWESSTLLSAARAGDPCIGPEDHP